MFQVSGEVTTANSSSKLNGTTAQEDENAMAVDDEEDKAEYPEDVLATKNVLVGESSLERASRSCHIDESESFSFCMFLCTEAKPAFAIVTSCHIYSLSASPIHVSPFVLFQNAHASS